MCRLGGGEEMLRFRPVCTYYTGVWEGIPEGKCVEFGMESCTLVFVGNCIKSGGLQGQHNSSIPSFNPA